MGLLRRKSFDNLLSSSRAYRPSSGPRFSRARTLLDLGEAGEITLRACPAILKRDQHWQMSNAEAKRLEPRFAEAGEPARRETD